MELDKIVTEVKESEEWEVVRMNLLEIGEQRGLERGRTVGRGKGRRVYGKILEGKLKEICKRGSVFGSASDIHYK